MRLNFTPRALKHPRALGDAICSTATASTLERGTGGGGDDGAGGNDVRTRLYPASRSGAQENVLHLKCTQKMFRAGASVRKGHRLSSEVPSLRVTWPVLGGAPREI